MNIKTQILGWATCACIALSAVTPAAMALDPTAQAGAVIAPIKKVIHQAKEKACPDFDFGKQIGKVCWNCFFPITIASVPVGGKKKDLPDDHAAPMCVCPGRSGYPSLGITLGWWAPDHIIENVRQPWCMPSIGGKVLSDDEGDDTLATPTDTPTSDPSLKEKGLELLAARWGGPNKKNGNTVDGVTYYNFHWIKFPIGYFAGWISDYLCSKKGNTGIDIAFMSEFDPSWNNDEMALWTSPETVLFTGPWAFIACAADGVASTVNKPMKSLFWCAGTWGQLYPFSGNVPTAQSAPRDASLNALKGVAKMHRFTLARKTYGNKAVCMDQLYFILPKQQYKFQTMFPMAEKKNHWIGASSFRWGEHRTIPGVGEDYLWLQWSFHNCCFTFW